MNRASRVVITTMAAAGMASAASFAVSTAFTGNGVEVSQAGTTQAALDAVTGSSKAEATRLAAELEALRREAAKLRGKAGARTAVGPSTDPGRSVRVAKSPKAPGAHASTGTSGPSGVQSKPASSSGTSRPGTHASTGSSGSASGPKKKGSSGSKKATSSRPSSSRPPAHGSTGSSGGGSKGGGGSSKPPAGGHDDHDERDDHDDHDEHEDHDDD